MPDIPWRAEASVDMLFRVDIRMPANIIAPERRYLSEFRKSAL